MKKALFLTDCSIDSALSLNRWMEKHPDLLLDLTVVHAYEVPHDTNPRVKAATYRAAKQEATHRLSDWAGFLPSPWPGQLNLETLLGHDLAVAAIYLVLRRYDCLLLNSWQKDALLAFATYQHQIVTRLYWVDVPDEVSYHQTDTSPSRNTSDTSVGSQPDTQKASVM